LLGQLEFDHHAHAAINLKKNSLSLQVAFSVLTLMIGPELQTIWPALCQNHLRSTTGSSAMIIKALRL